jgi:hypothetical protein
VSSKAKPEELPFLGGGYEKESLEPAAPAMLSPGCAGFFLIPYGGLRNREPRVNLFEYTRCLQGYTPLSLWNGHCALPGEFARQFNALD